MSGKNGVIDGTKVLICKSGSKDLKMTVEAKAATARLLATIEKEEESDASE